MIQYMPETYPGKAGLYKERIGLYEILGENDPSLIAVDWYKISELEPKNADAQYQYAVAGWRKAPQQALRKLNDAIFLSPKVAEYYALRGRLRAELNDCDRGMDDANKALELDPNLADGYSAKGQAELGLSKNDDAVKDIDKALSLDPKLVEPLYKKGLALENLHKSDAAIAAFEQFMALKSKETKMSDEDKRHLEQAKRKIEILQASLPKSEGKHETPAEGMKEGSAATKKDSSGNDATGTKADKSAAPGGGDK